MAERLVLLGGGGHASDVLAVLESRRPGAEVVIGDDGVVDRRRFEGRFVRIADGGIDQVLKISGSFIAAVGDPSTRIRIAARGDDAAVRWADPQKHLAAVVHPSVELAEGAIVFGCVWISPMARIGRHTHVGYGATVGHDTAIGAFCSVMPSASIGGDCRIGSGVLIGAGATVLQGLSVGRDAVVGAGSVVTKDVADAATVLGVPAREVRQ